MSNETNFPNNSNHPQSANIPVESLAPFTRFCCSLGMIPSSYKASMSYEEQLMWLCDYLENTVIPTVNNNTDVTNEVQELFNQLHDYVENYFTNLDVQQEINNKLDEMASDGTLISIVAPYLQPFIDEQNNRISQVENFVYATTNINPLVASSISGMTDTSRIYVLTTDGHLYYFNGTTWADGGVYQAIQVANDSISYNELSDFLKETTFEKITADDMIWIKGVSLYDGAFITGTNVITSQMFRMAKGQTITINENFNARITYYHTNKTYGGFTGSFRQFTTPWIAPYDCYVRISLQPTNPELEIQESDGNSTNVDVFGIIPLNNGSSIINNLKFTKSSDTVYSSQNIYCGKGTIISFIDQQFKDRNNNNVSTFFSFGVNINGVFGEKTTVNRTSPYVIPEDGFIRINVNVYNMNLTNDIECY